MRSDILQFLPILLISCRTDPRRSATSQPSWAVAGFSPISNGVLRPPLRRRRGPPPRRRNAAADDGTVEYAAREAETSGVGRNVYTWDVYVSVPPNKNSNRLKEKCPISPSDLVQSFISLSPTSETVRAHAAMFHKQGKQRGKGLTVRCVRRLPGGDGNGKDGPGEISSAMEITNVDSVDKVYRIMTEHMRLEGIDPNAYECMRSYIDGNRNLEEGEISLAIFLYDKALAAASAQDRTSRLPRGSILMRRARAYLGRAANHRNTLRTLVRDLSDAVPSASTVKILYQTASTHPALSSSIFARLACDSRVQQAKFRQIRYRHDMYEFALLHAARDGLQSTQVLPNNAGAWLLAGECLAELRKLEESNRYYQRALEIDPSIGGKLGGVMEKNRASQEFLDVARASGFSGDTLRLAIDVAA